MRIHELMRVASCLVFVWAWFGWSPVLGADAASNSHEKLAPQYLLGLLHAPEVHAELKLSGEQVAALEQQLRKVDEVSLRTRNQPNPERFQIVRELEKKILLWIAGAWNEEQQQRLTQLHRQSQGSRLFFRDDVIAALKLTSDQIEQLAQVAAASNLASEQMAKLTAAERAEKGPELQKTIDQERTAFQTVLTKEQLLGLSGLIGEPFDTASLKRIYPFAPEFSVKDQWINSSPLSSADLRGKVLLVHFYAFQCSNCQANFKHYNRWHEQLSERGVVVIGIQTPETSSERIPAEIKQAAKSDKFLFPVIMDLDRKYWDAWANTMWPTVYVVDQNGYIRHWWQGELNWQGATADKEIEKVVEELLKEKSSANR